MKVLSLLSLTALWTPTTATVVKTATVVEGDKTIGKVVKLLEDMLEKSKTEAKEEKTAYAKYKCYCDQNEAEKTQSVKDLTNQIEFLGTKIAQLTAENGELSQECMALTTQMMQNEATRKQSESLREQSHEAFLEQESDMDAAIGGFKEAIDVLAEVGGNAFLAEPDKFMAGHKESLVVRKTMSQSNLAKIKLTVQGVLGAASSNLTPEQRSSVEGFLQAPAAGVVAQSGAIVGILKQMLETFKDNLENAKDAEKMEKKAQKKYMKDLEEEHKTFSGMKDDKIEIIGSNDEDLSSKKEQLGESKQQLEDDKEFLEKLKESCETKAKEYKKRALLRTNEDAAIAEAISILDSDEAFAAFGKTDATSTGSTSFLQVLSSSSQQAVATRLRAVDILQNAARSTKSMRLIKVATMLEKKNPFDRVIKEIEDMLALIVKEQKADEKQLDWCDSEREGNDSELSKRVDQIKTLEGEIDDLDSAINHPETGLLVQIKNTESDITENQETQASERKTRNEEHSLFLEDSSNLKAAEAILKRAIAVLKRYYEKLEEHLASDEFVQVSEEPAPPDAEFNTAGQSEKGNEVLDMLNFILGETEKERGEAEKDEDTSQSSFESSIESLEGEMENLEGQLASLNEDLAEKKKALSTKKVDLKDTTHAKEAIEKYIKEIEPGCDFITDNMEMRTENRDTETAALEKADALIKATPAYKKFEEDGKGK